MKQIEYDEKQKMVIDILQPFKKLARTDTYSIRVKDLWKVVEELENHYDIKPQYLTLREYINKMSCGAYHHFYFTFNFATQKLEVERIIDTSEFERYYNPELLDKYFVIEDKMKDNGGNCENYNCDHYLEISEIDL